jgi:hypothetical protein
MPIRFMEDLLGAALIVPTWALLKAEELADDTASRAVLTTARCA